MVTTARDKFKKGDRVERSKEAIRRDIATTSGVGVVVGFSTLNPNLVRVQRDGLKSPEVYHMSFWEVA